MSARTIFWGGLGLAVLGAICLIGILMSFPELASDPLGSIKAVQSWTLDMLQRIHPAVYILAFLTLPGFGFPLTLFYITVAAVMGGPVQGLLTAWVCVSLNLVASHWLARGMLHPVVERLLKFRGYSVPRVPGDRMWKINLAVRFSPTPYAVQNFGLALADVPLSVFLACGVPAQIVIGSGMILVGESLFTGGVKYAFLGIFLVLLAMIVVQTLRARYRKDNVLDDPAVASEVEGKAGPGEG